MFSADGNVLAALVLFTTGLGSLGLLGAGAEAEERRCTRSRLARRPRSNVLNRGGESRAPVILEEDNERY